MSANETLLVAGASGHLGRLVLDALVRSGACNVVATTRTPSSLAEYAAKGVQVRAADYNQAEGLVEAFHGATHMLLISTHEVGERLTQQFAALDAAKRAGVKHVFYTSHSDPEKSVSVVAPDHAAMEARIMESGLKYTLLRNFLYSENLLLLLPESLRRGTIYGASGDGKIAFLTRKDCAEAAAGAMMTASAHENRTYEITGPRGYNYTDIARICSKVLGREIVYVDLTPEKYRDMLTKNGVDWVFVEALCSFELAIRLGELEKVTDMVEQLTGHPPESLESFLEANLLSGQDWGSLQDVITITPA